MNLFERADELLRQIDDEIMNVIVLKAEVLYSKDYDALEDIHQKLINMRDKVLSCLIA